MPLCGKEPEKGETPPTTRKPSFASNRPRNVCFIGQEEEGGREGFRHRSTPSKKKLLPATPAKEEDLALGV